MSAVLIASWEFVREILFEVESDCRRLKNATLSFIRLGNPTLRRKSAELLNKTKLLLSPARFVVKSFYRLANRLQCIYRTRFSARRVPGGTGHSEQLTEKREETKLHHSTTQSAGAQIVAFKNPVSSENPHETENEQPDETLTSDGEEKITEQSKIQGFSEENEESKNPVSHQTFDASVSETRSEQSILVIGDILLKNVQLQTPGTEVISTTWTYTEDIESKLREMKTEHNRRYSLIVLQVGRMDLMYDQLEALKIKVAHLSNFAKSMSESVAFSGPIPDFIDRSLSREFSSFNKWLSVWCPSNGVGFIDHWSLFSDYYALYNKSSPYPNAAGAALLSNNLDSFIRSDSSLHLSNV